MQTCTRQDTVSKDWRTKCFHNMERHVKPYVRLRAASLGLSHWSTINSSPVCALEPGYLVFQLPNHFLIYTWNDRWMLFTNCSDKKAAGPAAPMATTATQSTCLSCFLLTVCHSTVWSMQGCVTLWEHGDTSCCLFGRVQRSLCLCMLECRDTEEEIWTRHMASAQGNGVACNNFPAVHQQEVGKTEEYRPGLSGVHMRRASIVVTCVLCVMLVWCVHHVKCRIFQLRHAGHAGVVLVLRAFSGHVCTEHLEHASLRHAASRLIAACGQLCALSTNQPTACKAEVELHAQKKKNAHISGRKQGFAKLA